MKLSRMSRTQRQEEIVQLIKGRHFDSARFKQLLTTFGGSFTYEKLTYDHKSIPLEAYYKYGAKTRAYTTGRPHPIVPRASAAERAVNTIKHATKQDRQAQKA